MKMPISISYTEFEVLEKYLSSIQATLYKSARHVSYSGGGLGDSPGQ